jgi:transposase
MAQMQSLLSEKDEVIQAESGVIAEQKERIAMLEEHLRLATAKRFSPSSEQTPPEQGNLFNEAEVIADEQPEEAPQKEDKQKRSQAFF